MPPDIAALLAASPGLGGLTLAEIVPMPARGVAHDHYRILDRGLVLRIPRPTPWALPPEEQLAQEAAAFTRAEPSEVTPALHDVLPVSAALPRGALLVEEVRGRPVSLPVDLPVLAQSLACLHALPLPPPEARSPLPDHGVLGPVAATLAIIERQRAYFTEAALAPATRAALDAEYAWAVGFAGIVGRDQPLALVGSDTHPGNFVIRERNGQDQAVLVDLERVLYGAPAIDLAHATLYTSTTWDPEVQGSLSRRFELLAFYRRYLSFVPPDTADRLRPWLFPLRRLTWLRTMAWFVRWQAIAANGTIAIDPALDYHIRRRLADCLHPETVARIGHEWLAEPPFDL